MLIMWVKSDKGIHQLNFKIKNVIIGENNLKNNP